MDWCSKAFKKNQNNKSCRWRGFVFIRDQEIVVIEILVLSFSLFLTRFPNFSAIYTLWWDPWASRKTCALISYQKLQNVFSFDALVDFQKRKEKEKKRNSCSLLDTSYDVVTKQLIFFIWIKAFPVFLVKTWGHGFVPQWKQNKTKTTTRLADSFGNYMVHENILLSCNICFDPLLRKSSSRSLKCSERNWPMNSLLRLTLVQECKHV